MAVTIPAGVKPVAGYPLPLGDKILLVFDRPGPTSYTQWVASTQTGGDVITLAGQGPLNQGGFDYVDADLADTTGQIQVFPVMPAGGFGNATKSISLVYYSLVTATLGGQSQTAGTQIAANTNLSTFSWRLRALAV
jgi:hypothetical protein